MKPPKAATKLGPIKWTPQNDAVLRREYNNGASFSEIAAILTVECGANVSRQAAMGRAHRLNFPRRNDPTFRRAHSTGIKPAVAICRNHLGVGAQVRAIRQAKPSTKGNYSADGAAASGIISGIRRRAKNDPVELDEFTARVADVVSLHKPLLELRAMECRWADEKRNEAGLHTFCGNPTLDGCSYCEPHRNLARGIGTPSERAAAPLPSRSAA